VNVAVLIVAGIGVFVAIVIGWRTIRLARESVELSKEAAKATKRAAAAAEETSEIAREQSQIGKQTARASAESVDVARRDVLLRRLEHVAEILAEIDEVRLELAHAPERAKLGYAQPLGQRAIPMEEYLQLLRADLRAGLAKLEAAAAGLEQFIPRAAEFARNDTSAAGVSELSAWLPVARSQVIAAIKMVGQQLASEASLDPANIPHEVQQRRETSGSTE
jgi:hypothetical protein